MANLLQDIRPIPYFFDLIIQKVLNKIYLIRVIIDFRYFKIQNIIKKNNEKCKKYALIASYENLGKEDTVCEKCIYASTHKNILKSHNVTAY